MRNVLTLAVAGGGRGWHESWGGCWWQNSELVCTRAGSNGDSLPTAPQKESGPKEAALLPLRMLERLCLGFLFKVIPKGSSRHDFSSSSPSEHYGMKEEEDSTLLKEHMRVHTYTQYTYTYMYIHTCQGTHSETGPQASPSLHWPCV